MTSAAVFWPTLLGLSFLVAGLFTYRRDLRAATSRGIVGLAAFAPVFIAASLATFAGEHFTAARSLAQLVPKWLPARLFIAYLVGAAHLAAALSLVARRCIRWSTIFLALMFALFVLLMDLPGAIAQPGMRLNWIFPVREGTFAMGALALFAIAVGVQWPRTLNRLATVTRIWTALAIIYFGTQNILYPQFSPGVPDNQPTSSWVPLPHAIAYLTGILLIVFGIAMLAKKYGGRAGVSAGLLMLLLTIVLFVPDYFLARNASEYINAFNFVADTLLFSGMLLAVAAASAASEAGPASAKAAI